MSSSDIHHRDPQSHSRFTFLHLGALIVIELLPIALLLFKVLEVSFEPESRTRSWVATVGTGLLRRLDDISFWIFVAYAMACASISRSYFLLKREQDLFARPQARLRFLLASVVVAVTICSLYLLDMKSSKGTLYWQPSVGTLAISYSEWPNKDASIAWIYAIQRMEGTFQMAAYAAVSFFCCLGFALALKLRSSPIAQVGHGVVVASLTPLTAGYLFFAAFVALAQTLPDSPLSPTKPPVAIGAAVVYSLPFLALFFFCKVAWLGRLKIAFSVELPILRVRTERLD